MLIAENADIGQRRALVFVTVVGKTSSDSLHANSEKGYGMVPEPIRNPKIISPKP